MVSRFVVLLSSLTQTLAPKTLQSRGTLGTWYVCLPRRPGCSAGQNSPRTPRSARTAGTSPCSRCPSRSGRCSTRPDASALGCAVRAWRAFPEEALADPTTVPGRASSPRAARRPRTRTAHRAPRPPRTPSLPCPDGLVRCGCYVVFSSDCPQFWPVSLRQKKLFLLLILRGDMIS